GPAKPLGDAANVMGGLEERSPRLREHACPRDLLGERVESDGPLLQRLALELDPVPEDALDGRAVHVSREQRRRLYSYPPPSRVRGSPASQMGIAVAERAGARRHAQGTSPAGTVNDGRACPRLPPARPPPARRRVRRAGGPRAVDRGAGGRAVRRAGTPRAFTPRTGAAPRRPRRRERGSLGRPPRRGCRGGHARLRVLRGPPARRSA